LTPDGAVDGAAVELVAGWVLPAPAGLPLEQPDMTTRALTAAAATAGRAVLMGLSCPMPGAGPPARGPRAQPDLHEPATGQFCNGHQVPVPPRQAGQRWP
jgi:hypothetical protein